MYEVEHRVHLAQALHPWVSNPVDLQGKTLKLNFLHGAFQESLSV